METTLVLQQQRQKDAQHQQNLHQIHQNTVPITIQNVKPEDISMNEDQQIKENSVLAQKVSEVDDMASKKHIQNQDMKEQIKQMTNFQINKDNVQSQNISIDKLQEKEQKPQQNQQQQNKQDKQQLSLEQINNQTDKNSQQNKLEQVEHINTQSNHNFNSQTQSQQDHLPPFLLDFIRRFFKLDEESQIQNVILGQSNHYNQDKIKEQENNDHLPVFLLDFISKFFKLDQEDDQQSLQKRQAQLNQQQSEKNDHLPPFLLDFISKFFKLDQEDDQHQQQSKDGQEKLQIHEKQEDQDMQKVKSLLIQSKQITKHVQSNKQLQKIHLEVQQQPRIVENQDQMNKMQNDDQKQMRLQENNDHLPSFLLDFISKFFKLDQQEGLQEQQKLQDKKEELQQAHDVIQHQQVKKQVLSESPLKIEDKKQEQISKQVQKSEQKQKYRLTSQNLESLQQNKDNEHVFVQFTEYIHANQIDQHKKIVSAQKQNKIVIQHKQIDKQSVQNDLRFTFAGGEVQQHNQNELKTLDIVKQDRQVNSPTKPEIIGKISKRPLISQKKVHDVIVDLQKYDEKKTIIPKLQQRKRSSSKKTINLSRLEPNINLYSNIINLTVGELLSEEKAKEQQKLLNQIDQLKRKLYMLQTRKTVQFPEEETYSENLHVNKPTPGKIYRKNQQNLSRVSEPPFFTHRKPENRNQKAFSTHDKDKNYAGSGFSDIKIEQKQFQSQSKKGKPINFRIKRSQKSNYASSQFSDQKDKEIGFIKNKSKLEEDQHIQTRRQDTQVVYYDQHEKLPVLQIPAARQLDFQNYFREYCEKFFLNLGNDIPKRQNTQEQLVVLAKNTFRMFGINLNKQKKLILNVKKYKNCVSFIINQEKTILWYYEGKFYFGGWVNNHLGEGEKIGWGYDYVPEKYVYSGFFSENKRHGYGIMKLLSKEKDIIYEGNWANGFKHGIGKQIESNNGQYVGQWSVGKKQGKGKIKVSVKEMYDGNFINGLKSAFGNQIFKNGDSFKGQYKEGKFHGKGIYIWANNSRYEGDFVQGSRNGNGKWTVNYHDSNADSYEGVYLNDKKNGFGVYKWKDGTKYQGQFLNDLKHGQGIVSYSDGKTARLKWFQGNVVNAQEKSKNSETKKGLSKDSAKNSSSRPPSGQKIPVQKYNYLNNESRSKPTRHSQGFQKI